MHGELKKMCSSNDPYNPEFIEQLTEENWEVTPGTKAKDGSMLRPFIVFFGEAVPMIEVGAREVSEADIFVIVGTSLNVYPAAGLIHYVRPGKPIYLIDPNEVTQGKRDDITVIRKGASEGLEELMGRLEDIGI